VPSGIQLHAEAIDQLGRPDRIIPHRRELIAQLRQRVRPV
jgi:hypothetical protein